jgi:hypothetical protein
MFEGQPVTQTSETQHQLSAASLGLITTLTGLFIDHFSDALQQQSSSLPKEGNHSKGINAAIMLSEAGFSGSS